ncbi:MAG: nucleotide exchange factor GrpE [Candidatus Altimarinota bacterium]
MTQYDENTNEEILDNEFQDLQEESLNMDEGVPEKQDGNEEILKLKENLARTQADYQNFKMRSERDRQDMMFFLKHDILKKILPRVDDLERMIKNTPEDQRNGVIYEGVLVLEKSLKRDLEALGVTPYVSLGEEVNPDLHEVMTQIPSENPGKIVDEFEKGYMLGERVLRVAKVIVGA